MSQLRQALTPIIFVLAMGGAIFAYMRFLQEERLNYLLRAWDQAWSEPLPIAPALTTPANISIRVDEIEVIDVGDDDGTGELSLYTLAVRRQNRSAKLGYPPDGNTRTITPSTPAKLSDFSLTVNSIAPDEQFYVYFLAMDQDERSVAVESSTDTLVEAGLATLERLLTEGQTLPYADLAFFLAGWFSGNLAEWWRQADVIGLYRIDFGPSRNWYRDQSFEEVSIEGNMRLKFTVLSADSLPGPVAPGQIEPTERVTVVTEVTREIPVTREIVVTKVRYVTVEQTATPSPANQNIRPVQPINGAYKSPVTFVWLSEEIGSYEVIATNLEHNFEVRSGWLNANRWTLEIPKENYGNWQWYVMSRSGFRSEIAHFVFDPNLKDTSR